MPEKIVLQHSCRRPELDDALPFDCDCSHEISLKEARSLVKNGFAVWKSVRNANGNVIEDKSAVVLLHELRFKHARMIDDQDIKVAYVLGDEVERQRIDDWQKMPYRYKKERAHREIFGFGTEKGTQATRL